MSFAQQVRAASTTPSRIEFPKPFQAGTGRSPRWKLSDVLHYRDALAGDAPTPIAPEADHAITKKQACALLGISSATLWRLQRASMAPAAPASEG